MTLMYRYADEPLVYTETNPTDIEITEATPISSIEAEGEASDESDDLAELRRIAQMEATAPGIARAWLDAKSAKEARADTYRTLRLASILTLCMLTIAIGQWALVKGASTEALYLTGAGLAGLVANFMKAN